MSNKSKRQNDPGTFAVLHQAGRVWRGLVVRHGVGRDAQSAPVIVAAREFNSSMTSRIDSWLDEHAVSEVVCVLPACAVICRTCALPDAPIEQLEAALRLQAEAHLFGIAPQHRLGMAVLDQSPGESARSGIILAWPEAARMDLPPTNRPVSYTPDVAALAALVDGHRPPQPLLWLDRHTGSAALALSHATGVSFRGMREDDDDTQLWKASIGRAIAETGLNAGHTPDFIEAVVRSTLERLDSIEPDSSDLLLPAEIIDHGVKRLSGASADGPWWSQYGIAAGAAMVRTGPLAPLSRLCHSAPAEAPSRLRDAVEAMSSPRTAARLAVACLLVLMLGPLAINWARLKVLEMRFDDIDSQLRLVNDVRDSLIVYSELGSKAWPMTKILADIACNTPEGVELESIRINPGGSFTARGRALPHAGLTAPAVVLQMQKNLSESGIFTEVTLNWDNSDAYGNYEFETAARLQHPYRRYDYPAELDFGTLTLAERLYGPSQATADATTAEAGATDESPVSGDSDQTIDQVADATENPTDQVDPYAELYDTARADSSRVDRPRMTESRIGGDASRRDEVRIGSAGVAPSEDIPEPLTEAQVQAMSDAEVLDTLIRVSQARRIVRSRDDEELQQRLQREFDWLMARRRGEN